MMLCKHGVAALQKLEETYYNNLTVHEDVQYTISPIVHNKPELNNVAPQIYPYPIIEHYKLDYTSTYAERKKLNEFEYQETEQLHGGTKLLLSIKKNKWPKTCLAKPNQYYTTKWKAPSKKYTTL